MTALTCLGENPAAALRLVCFPHSGGQPGMFRRWVAGLAPDVEVWGATLPGRATRVREPFARQWSPLVAEITDAVLDEVPGPVALFGHSLGALLAFEVGRALTLAGRAPEHLVVSARATPATPYPLTLPDGDEELIEAVDRVYQGIPAALRESPDLLRLFAPVLRADLELAVSYVFRPGPPLSCPITALGGTDDPTVSEAELSAWSRHTSGAFTFARFPGGHFYLDAAERQVLDTLWRHLAPRHALTRSSS
ncbi:thioesterase II family protein [Nonomuraea gerenzanensis]|uniref:Thioesterase in siderophore biosynthesis gene cluster n=1 Tax=Nonomuraea gerenzanensis TaxID=93944 RepID=A0A1M4E900_9ACTN|nr:alpha/beta fold hydrolase [Nonomuraea gerenzanensis]UBU17382.1 alpha/beta fold hydrolase [Nonomuraea gerenzanensis]SBO95133.1 Thioesterase in siderophore biosynthesis gene cluster [Nonomuraea gerenzanensis]